MRTNQKALSALLDCDLDEPCEPLKRLKAGRIVTEILRPVTGYIDRKVETVEFIAPNINRRTIDFEVRPR